jgi:HSP20 family protein
MVDFKSLVPWRNKSDAPARREAFYEPFLSFRREIDRMLDDFHRSFEDFLNGGLSRPIGAGWAPMTPAIDVDETDKEVIVTAELPGVSEKDLEVSLAGDVLTIKGEKKAEREQKNGGAYYMERRFGSFARSIRLPFEASDQTVDARFENGVLTVHVPKPDDYRRSVRRIQIKSVKSS